MAEIKKTSTMHYLALCAGIIALLSFFLPFVQITFIGTISWSGLDFIAEAIDAEESPALLSVLCPILCVVGIICSFVSIKNSKAAVGTIAASAIGMIMMVVAMSDSDADIVVYINYAAFGFYLYEIMSLVAIVVSFPILQMGEGSSVKREKKTFNIPKITFPKFDINFPEKPPTSAKNICPKCKKVQQNDAVFCRYCGASLVKPEGSAPLSPDKPSTSGKDGKVICPKCGARHIVGTTKCKYCGTAISGDTEYGQTTAHNHASVKKDRKVICPKCGARHIVGTTKCKYCGTLLK